MQIGSNEWSQLIRDGARAFDLDLNHHHTHQFAVHAKELVHWNLRINITSITDPSDIAVKHFLDSLAAAPLIPPEGALLDIGSGGGFPGIPLKILLPSLSVTLIDASRKKVNFLKHILRTLTLENIEALHIRAEDLAADPNFLKRFDVIISRALTDLASFVRLALPLLAAGGIVIALKGQAEKKDVDSLPSTTVLAPLTVEQKVYTLPFVGANRSMVIMRKNR